MTTPSPLPAHESSASSPLLIALDVDGTVVSWQLPVAGETDGHEQVSDEVRAALQDVVAAGHHVVLATGRSVFATLRVIRELHLDIDFAVCSNGAVTIRLTEDGYDIIDLRTFDARPAIELLHAAVPEALIATEVLGKGFRMTGQFPLGELDGEHTFVEFDELGREPVTRVVVRSLNHSAPEFGAEVAKLGLHGVATSMGWTAWLDITPHGVSKASALEDLRAMLHVEPHRTVAVGDGLNDHEMLQWAARGIAMGQALPETKACADEVTGSIEEDGLVPVLRSVLA